MKILIIEDEEGLIITLTDRLRNEGFETVSASDGEAGYKLACEQRFDLILLDVMLPKKNGYDVCRDLRKVGNSTPILMLTAKGETVDKVVGLKLGADDYLTKPFEVIELLARVEALLRRSPVNSSGVLPEKFAFERSMLITGGRGVKGRKTCRTFRHGVQAAAVSHRQSGRGALTRQTSG